MSRVSIPRPAPTEYAPQYEDYVRRVPQGDIIHTLERQLAETSALLSGIAEDQANFRYAPGKWSIKEVLGHLTDTERIFTYRALCFARNDKTALPGFDENDYVRFAKFYNRTVPDLLNEFGHVRNASIGLFQSLDEEEMVRRGVANGREFTTRSIAYIVAGHERHHLSILRERYLSAKPDS